MNWSSFTAGIVIGSCTLMGLYFSLPPAEPFWRQCAPAQAGEALVSTTQQKDSTECNYSKKSTGRVIHRTARVKS